jgi:hypothetical protein
MPPRLRKLVGSAGVVGFLLAYIWLVVVAADHVPRSVWLQTAFFVAAGVLWGVPLIPLIRWMNGGGTRQS